MAGILKYRQLMIDQGVSEDCPSSSACEQDRIAYHFGFDPIEDSKNFIPGHKRRKQRINHPSDPKNCAYCGLSMYKSLAGAVKKWREMNSRSKQLLEYTHLLEGRIVPSVGLATDESGEHFTLFEYEGTDLREHFRVFDIL